MFPSYIRHLYGRLPPGEKGIMEADGSAHWMLNEAYEVIGGNGHELGALEDRPGTACRFPLTRW